MVIIQIKTCVHTSTVSQLASGERFGRSSRNRLLLRASYFSSSSFCSSEKCRRKTPSYQTPSTSSGIFLLSLHCAHRVHSLSGLLYLQKNLQQIMKGAMLLMCLWSRVENWNSASQIMKGSKLRVVLYSAKDVLEQLCIKYPYETWWTDHLWRKVMWLHP